MNEWPRVPLSKLARVDRGASWGKEQERSDGSGIPVIRIANMQPEGLDLSEVRSVVGISERDRERSLIRPESLLMIGSNGNPERVGNVYAATDEIVGAALASFLIGIHPATTDEAQWLLCLMGSSEVQQMLTEATAGSTGLKNLSLEWLRGLPIPLPPLPEQRRIVDLVGALDAQIAAIDLERSACLTLARLLPVPVEPGSTRPLGASVRARGGKRMPKGEPFAESATEHPYLRVIDMQDGTFRAENLMHVPDHVWPLIRRYIVETDQLVISIVGTIGRVALVPAWARGANLTENAAVIDILDESLDRVWLCSWLASEPGQREIERVTVGTSQGKLALIRIPLIEIPEIDSATQAALGSACAEAQALARSLRGEGEALRDIRARLLTAILRGEVEIPESYDALLGEAV